MNGIPKKHARLPLSSFDPRFRELLMRGAVKEFSITCETIREARAMRARIHTYRSQAKMHYGDAGRAEWEPLYLCRIVLVKSPAIRLCFEPRQAEFDHLLSKVPDLATPSVAEEVSHDLLDKLESEQKAHEGDN